jgi:hypothetical protein
LWLPEYLWLDQKLWDMTSLGTNELFQTTPKVIREKVKKIEPP